MFAGYVESISVPERFPRDASRRPILRRSRAYLEDWVGRVLGGGELDLEVAPSGLPVIAVDGGVVQCGG